MKKYNAVNSKWFLLGLVVPILLFFFSFNMVYAYFTATAKDQQASTQTAIVRIGFTEDDSGNKTSNSIVRNSETVTVSTILPGDTLNAQATIINNGNVPVYSIFNFALEITRNNTTETIANDYYTFTTDGTLTKIDITNITTEIACELSANATVDLVVPTYFKGSDYANDYQNATINYTFTGYAIQTSHLTATSAITQIVTDLLGGGN